VSTLNETIKAEAERLGFSFLHITRPTQPPHYQAYLNWLADSHAGEMDYLSNERAVRTRGEPASLLENARSLLAFGVRYSPQTQFLRMEEDPQKPIGLIASYALHADYHALLKQAAHHLMDFIQRETNRQIRYKVFVDSSTLLEKDTAFMAGAGWVGRNSLLITPGAGSFQVLGCILSNLELSPEAAFSRDLCGECQKCRKSCPTGCITENHNLDANACIAYLTIEYKGVVPRHLRSKIGKWVFGCDVCQNVCPWNTQKEMREIRNPVLPLWQTDPKVDLLEEIKLNEDAFRAKYAASPILRATHAGFRRNLIIAMGNSDSAACVPILKNLLAGDPNGLLRLHAAWALTALHPPDLRQTLEKALSAETDERVRAELRLDLAETN
jgi:epoxyqueuosine reductase